MSAMEIRAHLCEVRAAPEGNGLRFEGYAAKFDRWSEDLGGFRERIAPGAFARSIAGGDAVALLNHDPNYVLGRVRSGTLQLDEDATGLHFVVDAPDVGWARDLRESVRRGDITQCSFAFRPIRQEWVWAQPGGPEMDERTLLDVELDDVSIVTRPAYPDTEVYARSARDVRDDERRRAIAEKKTANANCRRRRLDLKQKTDF